MIQNTLLRVSGFEDVSSPMIICNDKHRFLVSEQLREIGIRTSGIFLEPVGRNTAPAVAVSALKAASIDSESLILVLPADHLIENISKFHNALKVGKEFAAKGNLVTFGIVPDRPETGYGYIRKGQPIDITDLQNQGNSSEAYGIYEFVEKPDLQTAKEYTASGDYCWNSGMFMFHAKSVLSEFKQYVPDIMAACERAFLKGETEKDFFYLDRDSFEQCPSDSIDYAVMEKTDQGVMIPLDAGWDDLGSWEALWNVGDKDSSNNVIKGDVICVDTENSLIDARNRLVTVLGVKNLAVIETQDAVLVSSLTDTQGVKKIVDSLRADKRKETITHRKIYQPWGYIESIDQGEGFCLRKIYVSRQTAFQIEGHQFDELRWMILQGSAAVYIGDEKLQPAVNESLNIKPLATVKLENLNTEPLIVLEVISGDLYRSDHFDSA